MDYRNYNIKTEIKVQDLRIILLDMFDIDLPKQSISNLFALDNDNNFVWQAEPPKTHYDIYYDIKFVGNWIYADTSNSFVFRIDLETGKIIDYSLLK